MRIMNLATVLTCVLMISAISAVAQDGGPTSREVEQVAAGNTAFALDLYGKLRSGEGNLFFSPYSISTALAMTYSGARGKTADEMAATLHFTGEFPPGQGPLNASFSRLEERLNVAGAKKGIELSVANSLWPHKEYVFLPGYIDQLKKFYGATVMPVDYAKETETARKTINAWVEDKTRKKIVDLIQPGVLSDMTRLVLVNAIYFKGRWVSPFDKSMTQKEPFKLVVKPGKTVNVPMMRQNRKYRYGEQADMQILGIPYAGKEFSMIVFLPRKDDGIGDVEKVLNVQNIGAWLKSLRDTEVDVTIPKFRMTSQFSLSDTLKSLGIRQAFEQGRADFSGMDGHKDRLFISAVIHKAFVDMNEEGTEAAAATAVAIAVTAAPMNPPPVFRADHPFLFLIRDNLTGSILFMGRVMSPAE